LLEKHGCALVPALVVFCLTRTEASGSFLMVQHVIRRILNTTSAQIWEIQFHEPATITPPHTEDIIVTNQRLLGMQPDLRAFLQARVAPHPGNPARLYNGMIRFTGAGSGYISADAGVPGYSTCYWLPDRQLRRADDYLSTDTKTAELCVSNM